MVESHDDRNGRQLVTLHVQSVSGVGTRSKAEQEVNPQGPPPVIYFLQWSSTPQRFPCPSQILPGGYQWLVFKNIPYGGHFIL